ncbi:MAG: hypothetical protein VX436_02575 [Planctomycetota bacterium]|nr:hypothetical protein [Planctomycetota bacterium]
MPRPKIRLTIKGDADNKLPNCEISVNAGTPHAAVSKYFFAVVSRTQIEISERSKKREIRPTPDTIMVAAKQMLVNNEGGAWASITTPTPANEHHRAVRLNIPFFPSPYRIASGWFSGLVKIYTPTIHIDAIQKSADKEIDPFSNFICGTNILEIIAGKTKLEARQQSANLRIKVGCICERGRSFSIEL